MQSILFIDDDQLLSKAIVEKFSREGFKVFEAKDGKEGLEIALKEHPDIILLDILMPVMDGIAMLRQLRMDPWGKKALVFILTNVAEKEAMAPQLEGLDAIEYLVKTDYLLDDILVKIRKSLSASA